jgi:endo-1,4-beta-xylanase
MTGGNTSTANAGGIAATGGQPSPSGGSAQAAGGSATGGGPGGTASGGTSGGGGPIGGSVAIGGSVTDGGSAGSGGAGTGGDLGAGGTGMGGDLGTGGTSTGGSLGSGGAQAGTGGTDDSCALPTSFSWTSTGPIIAPVSDASHDLVAIKDPTVVFHNGRWHVYASSVSSSGVYGLVYLSFTDFSEAASGTFYYMDQTPGFDTYVAAPQLFYFEPQDRWYLVFQSGPPMYSTNDDPANPANWTRPAPFFSSEPAIVTNNGGWLDFWVICDDVDCYLFFSNDHGRWYRSVTGLADFPNGFSEPVVVMEDEEAGRLFEACNVYKIQGTKQYLALIEAFDATSNWDRYFRSWTADSLDGPWTPLADSGSAPFAGSSNVSFDGAAWTSSISHGELIRAGYDQTLTIDPCDLRFLYQGHDPAAAGGDYNDIPWRLGLLTGVR